MGYAFITNNNIIQQSIPFKKEKVLLIENKNINFTAYSEQEARIEVFSLNEPLFQNYSDIEIYINGTFTVSRDTSTSTAGSIFMYVTSGIKLGTITSPQINYPGSNGSGSVSISETIYRFSIPASNTTNKIEFMIDTGFQNQSFSGIVTIYGIPHNESGLKTVSGSYIGTGKYGIDNPNSLIFTSPPKLLMVQKQDNASPIGDYHGGAGLTAIQNTSFAYTTIGNNSTAGVYLTWDENSVSWYCSTNSSNTTYEENQLNILGATYLWLAIL